MTSHVSILEVHQAIRNNDQAALEKAIFFFGVRIHRLQVWGYRSPLYYSAFLGHMDLVKILISDLAKYRKNYLVNGWFGQLLKHHETQLQSVAEITKMTLSHCQNFGDFKIEDVLIELVRTDAFELVDSVLKGREESISKLALYCVNLKKPFSNLPLWVRQHDKFIQTVKEYEQYDPILISILQGEYEKVRRMIHEYASQSKPENQLLCSISVDTTVLEMALDGATFERTLSVCGWVEKNHHCLGVGLKIAGELTMPVKEVPLLQLFFLTILYMAELFQTRDVIEFVLSHERFDKSCVDWTKRYYRLLSDGLVRYASYIKHLVDFSYERKKEIFEEFKNRDCSLEFLPVEEFTEASTELASLGDLNDFKLGNKIKNLPKKENRPDLVRPISLFLTLDYAESDIEDKKEREMFLRFPEVVDHVGREDTEGEPHTLASLFLSDADSNQWCFDKDPADEDVLMDNYDEHYELLDLYIGEKEAVARQCVLETGKPVTVFPWHDPDYPEIRPVLDQLQTARAQHLDLKKQCRLAIRKSIFQHLRSSGVLTRLGLISLGKVMDSLTSLYVHKRLPKLLVNYLLYRESNDALYYKLLSPGMPMYQLTD